jgi:hypothetical protein
MTKTEYAQYLQSPEWQERRGNFLIVNNSCVRCEIPRWLAEIAYDQDLNVHHISYSNLGDEDEGDLEPLCRRCHEIAKFGRSDLREPKSTLCGLCRKKHWNYYSNLCSFCNSIRTRDLAKLVYVFDKKLDGCELLTVNNYLIALLMLHHEGPDRVLEIWRQIEPFAKKAQQASLRCV